MAFITEQNMVPDSIGDISITITDYVNQVSADQIHYSVQILQADGSIFNVKVGNLVLHLTTGQISALIDFMAVLRTKAETEFLP